MAGESEAGARSGGLLNSLKQLVATVGTIAQTRLELLGDEIQAEKHRVAQVLLFGAAAVFCLACSLLLVTVLVIVMLWESNRLLAIGGFSVMYLALGLALALAARKRAGAGTNLFQASIGELQKDRDRLST
jgi:uncharacterized membrane protein YqjE